MNYSSELKRILCQIGESGTGAEFKRALDKYGQDPDCLAMLEQGLAAARQNEDRGSYCENASAGWDKLCDREEILKDFYLGDDTPARSIAPKKARRGPGMR